MSQAGFKPGVGRVIVFEDCEATALTNQPPWLDEAFKILECGGIVLYV